MINKFAGIFNSIFIKAVNKLKGPDRRIILAEITEKYGYGGKSFVAKTFNAGRDTIRKGSKELKENKPIEDANNKKGRQSTLKKLPNIETDIREIAESQSQIDPKFQSERLYTKLTIKEIKKQLIEKKGYTDKELPTNQTLNTIVNKMGFKLRKIQKTRPKDKIPETDAIFNNLSIFHETINKTDKVLRLSLDAKDRVKIGCFSRNGKSRTNKEACDHDFGDKYITPFGIMNLNNQTSAIFMVKSKITADCIVDILEDYWNKECLDKEVDVIVLNIDNGSECNSKRTQFIKRIVEFVAKINKKIILAYYPPYHSKYNPIERLWGRLEQHWNSELLDSEDTVIKFAKSMTWKGNCPNVNIVNKIYPTQVKLKKKIMKIYESCLYRKRSIKKWFVILKPEKCKKVVHSLLN